MFVTITDPKKREKIVQDFLKTKNNVKQRLHEEKMQKQGYVEETEKLFKPVTKAITEKGLVDSDKIIQRQENILEQVRQLPSASMLPALPSSSSLDEDTGITNVSKLIVRYLQNLKSEASYSLRWSKSNDAYLFGKTPVHIDHNILSIAGTDYEATEGLMELLASVHPDREKMTDEDVVTFKNILTDTNAIYQNSDPKTGKLASSKGARWALIKDLFPELLKKQGGSLLNCQRQEHSNYQRQEPSYYRRQEHSDNTGGRNDVTFLPENPDALVNQLRLSIASMRAGNTGEFNKINAILDELIRTNNISNNDFKKIYRNLLRSS